jgi:heme/copper-type cytochrome/quinol oxidase subunit 2
MFSPALTPADSIYHLSLFVLTICGAIFVTAASLLLYSIVKFRRADDDDGGEPAQIHGSNQVELARTVIPILVVVVLFLATDASILPAIVLAVQCSATVSTRDTRSAVATAGDFLTRS